MYTWTKNRYILVKVSVFTCDFLLLYVGFIFRRYGQVDWDSAGWEWVICRSWHSALWLHRCGCDSQCHSSCKANILVGGVNQLEHFQELWPFQCFCFGVEKSEFLLINKPGIWDGERQHAICFIYCIVPCVPRMDMLAQSWKAKYINKCSYLQIHHLAILQVVLLDVHE